MHKKIKWANLPIAAFLVLFALICVLPFWLVLSGSLTGESEIMAYGYGPVSYTHLRDALSPGSLST